MVDYRMSRPVERGRERPFRQGHADRIPDSLAQRAGRGLNAEMQVTFRMPRGVGTQLAKPADLLHRQWIPCEIEHEIQQHRGMAIRKHESIPVPPQRIARVVLQYLPPQ